MKILLINNSYNPRVLSGAERLVHSLSKRLIERGHEVSIYSSEDYSNHINLSYGRRLISHIFGFFNISKYNQFKTFLAKESPDLIWSHNMIGFGLIVFLAFKKYKVIHSFHDVQLLHPSGLLMYQKENAINSVAARIYQLLCRMVFPKNAFCIFPSQWLKNLYTEKGFVLPHALALANPLREYKHIAKTADAVFSFLYLGQIEKHKGVDILISAFKTLANAQCRLIIAGSGSLEQELKSANQDARINFIGAVVNPEEHIAQASCLVVPSVCYENLPTAILEAQAQQTPVIASCLGGIKELISDDRYLFIPEEVALKEKLMWCLENKEELKKNAQDHVSASLSIDDYLATINSFARTTL